MNSNQIKLFQPRMPSSEEFVYEYQRMVSRSVYTNNGPILQQFESDLQRYLPGLNCAVTSSGTSALEAIFRCYELEGNIITTPFSYVATAHAARVCNLELRFAEIDKETLNLDPTSVEDLIDEDTSALVAVHTYGHACNNDLLAEIASKHNLRLIYDAAQAFGTQVNNKSILGWGDASAVSFHATKVLNAIEGGAVVTRDANFCERIRYYRRFGINDQGQISSIGLNAKMSEMHAMIGRHNLRLLDVDISKRLDLLEAYKNELTGHKTLHLQSANLTGEKSNGAYCAIHIDGGNNINTIIEKLNSHGIASKRYFYPLISNINTYQSCRQSTNKLCGKLNEMICLPLHVYMDQDDVKYIVSKLIENQYE